MALLERRIGLSGIAFVIYMTPHARALPPGEGLNLNYGAVLAFVAVATCISNCMGWPVPPYGGLYLVTVWSIVAIAAGNFVELIFRKVL